MTLADSVAAVLFAGLLAYAVFGGADFGSGVWDLTAGGDREGGDRRRLIDQAIGPVWEANHVWLIFVVVYGFTGFPGPFASVMSTLYVPLSFAVLGIVARGTGFAFRKVSGSLAEARVYGVLFATSSVITPFFFGTVAGAVASGRVPAEGTGDRWTSWTGPTALVGGVLAVLTCSFLAACFLAAEGDALGRPDLARWFGRRALLSGVVTGGVALVAIWPLAADAPTLFDRLTGRALPVVLVSAAAGVRALWLIHRQRWARARISAVVAVAAVVAGWGAAQYPWFLVDEVSIEAASGDRTTLWALLVTTGIAAAVVLPSLVYLLRLANDQRLSHER